MHFYEQLKGMRRTKGFTIRELADRSGVSAAYISQLENGNRGVPSPDVLMKLSEGLNAPYTELMKIAGYLEPPADTKSDASRKPHINLRRFLQENELIFDGIELTEQDKEWIERVLTAMFWRDKQQLPASGGTPASLPQETAGLNDAAEQAGSGTENGTASGNGGASEEDANRPTSSGETSVENAKRPASSDEASADSSGEPAQQPAGKSAGKEAGSPGAAKPRKSKKKAPSTFSDPK
ncbi:Transcriptional regulator, contains XRE-family HTH domain [Paenibacillus sp. UNCCL117]|uniref:helix-turn-helix transcriptional regulator n=1 Tax=unclassified Paenibacillus TaxID=185978 RepID=UPI000890C144|nr:MULTISPECIES: helix-turn-helix transcriptional regulator [unclassified Paenibacillus]SDC23758.1 Transcriptional regulator, contains XRE-family HTH domain [Paenibacillus sp. cl123]SFW19378.1 Transcriptional regulator, contains XRE-family HTH domain [Paenibacillus sp. UNCCL117]